MENVLLVIHLFIAMALIGIILLQPSADSGGLMSSSSGGFMSPRGSANLLTRATMILAGLFMLSSLSLVALSGAHKDQSIFDKVSAEEQAPEAAAKPAEAPAVPTGE